MALLDAVAEDGLKLKDSTVRCFVAFCFTPFLWKHSTFVRFICLVRVCFDDGDGDKGRAIELFHWWQV